jgi:hypothetical protein
VPDVTRLLDAAAAGHRVTAGPPHRVDAGRRKLAAARIAAETPDHSLGATAPVYEAARRLGGPADGHSLPGLGLHPGPASGRPRRNPGRRRRPGRSIVP